MPTADVRIHSFDEFGGGENKGGTREVVEFSKVFYSKIIAIWLHLEPKKNKSVTTGKLKMLKREDN